MTKAYGLLMPATKKGGPGGTFHQTDRMAWTGEPMLAAPRLPALKKGNQRQEATTVLKGTKGLLDLAFRKRNRDQKG